MTAANQAPAAVSTRPAISAKVIVLFWLIASALWFGSLSFRDLAGTDEGRYAEIAREMAQSGDFVTPRLNDLKYFEKPALQYWVTAAAYDVFGENEFSARLWPALCGFFAALMVWYTGRRLWGREAGLFAGIGTLSMVWMFGVSHVITVDMSVSFFLTVSLCSFLIAQDASTPASSRRPWMLLVWAAMAGAMLSKGLIGMVIPGAVLVLYSLIYRDWKTWWRMELLWGPILFIALAAPWFVIVSMRNPEFAKFFFIHEHFQRFATNEARRPGGWYYFIPVLVGGLLPWTTLLPSLTRYAARREAGEFQPNGVLLAWCGFIFVFFSLSSSKLPGYILPMFPAIGLLLGRYLAAAKADVLRPHLLILAVLWTAGLIYLPFFAHTSSRNTPMEYNQQAAYWLAASVGTILLFTLLAWRCAKLGRKDWSVLLIGAGGVLFGTITMAGYQVYSPMVSARNAASLMAPYIKPDTEVFSIQSYEQGLPFYLKRPVTLVNYVDEFDLGQQAEPQKWIPTLQAFVPRWNAAPSAVARTNPDTYEQLQKLGVPMTVIYSDTRRVLIRKP